MWKCPGKRRAGPVFRGTGSQVKLPCRRARSSLRALDCPASPAAYILEDKNRSVRWRRQHHDRETRSQADRCRHEHRPCASEGRRYRPRARLLSRRARLRAEAALRHAGGVHRRGRLSPSHRAQHLGKRRRPSARARHHRPLSSRHPLSDARGAGRRAAPRSTAAGIQLDGASDHGVSEALYLRDPDNNGVELYWDKPKEQWPYDANGELAMMTKRLDLNSAAGGEVVPQPLHRSYGRERIPADLFKNPARSSVT